MKHFIKLIIEDIKKGENIDLIVTVALVIIISIFGVIGMASSEIVSSVTLAVLGLMAIGLLGTRYKIDDIHRKKDSTNLFEFMTDDFPELKTELINATEIWMVGLMLKGTTTRHYYHFKEKASQGTTFRTLIVNMNKIDLKRVVDRFSRIGTPEQFQADFAQTIKQYDEFRQNALNPKNVQLKTLDFVPSISLYVFPKRPNGGVVYVELYGYKSSLGSIPKFRVTEHENPQWYKHFLSQFEIMWNVAEEALKQ
jgi:hypothetical protein